MGKIPLEKEMAPHSTILVWRTQGYRLWGLQSMGLQSMEVAKSRIRLSPHAHITSIKFHSGGVGGGGWERLTSGQHFSTSKVNILGKREGK